MLYDLFVNILEVDWLDLVFIFVIVFNIDFLEVVLCFLVFKRWCFFDLSRWGLVVVFVSKGVVVLFCSLMFFLVVLNIFCIVVVSDVLIGIYGLNL